MGYGSRWYVSNGYNSGGPYFAFLKTDNYQDIKLTWCPQLTSGDWKSRTWNKGDWSERSESLDWESDTTLTVACA